MSRHSRWGTALEDGVEPFVCQAVACQLKKPELVQALCNGKGILRIPHLHLRLRHCNLIAGDVPPQSHA
jgi:hypothetical protein